MPLYQTSFLKTLTRRSLYGDSEVLIGKWFKKTGKRSEIFLASKFGFVKGSTTYEIDSSGEYCKKACEESLKLLDTEYIDLCKSRTPEAFENRWFEGETDLGRLHAPRQSQDPHRGHHASSG